MDPRQDRSAILASQPRGARCPILLDTIAGCNQYRDLVH